MLLRCLLCFRSGFSLGRLCHLLAACRAFDAEQPDRLVLYSPGYSVNLVWAKLAEKRGVAQYYIQGSNNLSDRLQKLIAAKVKAFDGQPKLRLIKGEAHAELRE